MFDDELIDAFADKRVRIKGYPEVFVVVARRIEQEGNAAARRFAEQSMSALLFVLLPLLIVAVIAMPWVMLALVGSVPFWYSAIASGGSSSPLRRICSSTRRTR